MGRTLDRAVRDAARHLSVVRDADVMRGWVERLGLDVRLEPISDREERSDAAIAGFEQALRLVEASSFAKIDDHGVTRALTRSWTAARGAWRDAAAAPDEETLHEFRKRVKRLMYQGELLSGRFTELVPLVGLLDDLQEQLGAHHDLCVLHAVAKDPTLAQRAEAIVPHVLAAGRWVLSARGKHFATWLSTRPETALSARS